ncbi:MAG: hypothetical protein ABI954_15640, partial [Pyrinomonadaceae bacterium]
MTKKTFTQTLKPRNAIYVVAATLILLGSVSKSWSQHSAQAALAKPKEAKVEPANSSQRNEDPNKIKVVFDETAPGVVFIESNGQRIRVDSNKKTIEQLA